MILPVLWVLALAASVSAPPEADQFDDAVAAQAASISKAAGFIVRARIADTSTEIDAPSTVLVSRAQIQRLFNHSHIKQFNDALGLIMAHETAHLAQAALYGSAIFQSGKELQRVYECQADILAGKYLTESFPHSNPNTPQDLQAIPDALQLLYDTGSQDDRVFANHPTPDERRECVRLGMAAGTMVNLSSPDVGFYGSAMSLAQKLDWLPAGPMPWSLDRAKHVLHFPASALSEVGLLDPVIHYNTDPGDPVVHYAFTYENESDRAMALDLDIQCVLVPRDNPKDTSHTELISNRHYKFTLASHGTYRLSGTLPWAQIGVFDPTLMPHLSFPPQAGSLVTATFR